MDSTSLLVAGLLLKTPVSHPGEILLVQERGVGLCTAAWVCGARPVRQGIDAVKSDLGGWECAAETF